MSIVSGLRYLYLAWFSEPKSQRAIYRHIRRHRVSSILEVGIGDGTRSLRMLQVAGSHGAATLRYAAIDQFDMRPEHQGAPLSLKEAHRRLRQSGVQPRLLPGDPYSALARGANGLGKFDLVVISAHQNDDALARAWFYVPRILNADSCVLLEEPTGADGSLMYRAIRPDEINALAQPSVRQKAA